MREIKFRAWDGKEMQKVYQLQFQDGKGIVARKIMKTGIGYGDGLRIGEIKNAKLMQYTGLKDKNGKEMFYGDLVKLKTKDDYVYEVKKDNFNIPIFEANGYEKKPYTLIDFRDYFLNPFIRRDDFEIIGNIYENPDLLNPIQLIN